MTSSKDAINTLQALRELSLSQRNVKKSDLEYSQWIMRELNGTLLPLYTNQIATFLVIEFLNQERDVQFLYKINGICTSYIDYDKVNNIEKE